MEGKEITISLCMIVRNEENTIARCLDSIKGVSDEISHCRYRFYGSHERESQRIH